MKNLLKELNMTIRQFSEKYEIPYNTVRQWERGLNSPPKYVINLLREKVEREKNGEQIRIQMNKIYYMCYRIDEKGKTGVFKGENIDSVQTWIKNSKSKIRWIDVHEIIKSYNQEEFKEILEKGINLTP